MIEIGLKTFKSRIFFQNDEIKRMHSIINIYVD